MKTKRRVDRWIDELLQKHKCSLRKLFEKALAWANGASHADQQEVDAAFARYRDRGCLVEWMRKFVYLCRCGRCSFA